MLKAMSAVLITDLVLSETTWTLAFRFFRASRADLIDLVNNLLQDSILCSEDDEVVWSALQAFRHGRRRISQTP